MTDYKDLGTHKESDFDNVFSFFAGVLLTALIVWAYLGA